MPPASPPRLDQDGRDEARALRVVGKLTRGAGDFLTRGQAGDAETDDEGAFGGQLDRGVRVRDRVDPALFRVGRIELGKCLFTQHVRVRGAPGDALDTGDLRGVPGGGGADFDGAHGVEHSQSRSIAGPRAATRVEIGRQTST
ncbi:hypothetical protein Atai01_59700 [Amycolatopsis taiwanensis]|uniref:Uncharacterized protein n=1 Tax=Amycolatopsis taiwanensis TaxID=342230 RepID=A0A9W6VKB6_9PSEU|nr:hypothetical protein Atai01_59700 [Amycolatopsis taiwanensis]